jgi:hypothetical protein
MAIDYSKLSDEELEAIANDDYSKLSEATLRMLAGESAPVTEAAPAAKAPPTTAQKKPEDTKPGFFSRRVPMRPDEYGERIGAGPEMGPSLREVKEAGVSSALAVPGTAARLTSAVTGITGEGDVSGQLRELEKTIASKAPSREAYEATALGLETLPYVKAAQAVSKIPVASRAGQAALQTAGQAGTAYAVTPEEEGRLPTAATVGFLSGLAESVPLVAPYARPAMQRLKGMFKTTGPVGATPAEEAALRITREVAPDVSKTEEALTAARTQETAKQAELQRLKSEYLENQKTRAARQAELEKQKIAAEAEKVKAKSDAEKAVEEARAKELALTEQVRDKGKQLTQEARKTDKVLEETNIREAAIDAKATLDDRATEFRNLSKQLREEADEAAKVAVETMPVRPKKDRATEFRDLVLSYRDKLKQSREASIGRSVDPKTGKATAAPFLETALAKEKAGQTVSESAAFRDLVEMATDRAENIGRYGEPTRKSHRRLLNEITPVKEAIDENGEVIKEVVPIRFEKLWEERRLISEARTGKTDTGYEAITGERREELLKALDDVLDEFGPGYKDFNKKWTEGSRPLDEFEFGVGEKATETRKFSRDNFVNSPEVVLDAALSKPSRSSAQNLKSKLVDEADRGKLENIVLESLADKAGGTAKGYDKVLKDYGEFLEEFPGARDTLRREADQISTAFGEAEKTAAFKKRWADRMEARAAKADKAIDSIAGLQGKIKTSLSSPLKEGALDEIGAFVRSNPNMRPKVGAALQDVLMSLDDRLITRALSVPERQAAFMRAGMERDQIDNVLNSARKSAEERAVKLAEVKEMGRTLKEAKKTTQEVKKAGKEATAAASEKVRETGRDIGKIGEERRAEEILKAQKQAEFDAARNLRVTEQQKRKALSELTPEMRDVINLEAEKIPLNTTEGLARAVSMASILGGLGSVVSGSPLGGLVAAGAAAAGAAGRRAYIKSQQKKISDDIKRVVEEILKDETGGAALAIERKIGRAEDVMGAQRVANKAMERLGFKPGTNAVTAATIYNAYAREPAGEPEEREPVAEVAPIDEETPEAPKAEEYSYESLNPDQVAKISQYMDRYGLNKDFLMNARTFNATPVESRKKLFDLLTSNRMARGGVVYTPAEQLLLKRYANR